MEFHFYAHANRKFKSRAVCIVDGGPEYPIDIVGEGNDLSYRIDTEVLDFGDVVYDKTVEKEFYIMNPGKVSFNFAVRTDVISRNGLVEVSPSDGRVFSNDKQKILVKVTPGLPERILEHIVVECAHFDPVKVAITATGIYSSLRLHPLPKIGTKSTSHLALVEKARENLIKLMEEEQAEESKAGDVATAGGDSGINNVIKREPSTYALELESERIRFRDNIFEKIMESERQAKAELLAASTKSNAVEVPSLKLTAQRSTRPKQSSTGNLMMLKRAPPFIMATYLADFGYVTCGSKAKVVFKVTNTGTLPISFDLDKNLALMSGFTIEPEKVSRLPEGESAKFKVVFQSKKSLLGKIDVVLPIEVRNGPLRHLRLSATCVVPTIKILQEDGDGNPMFRSESLDFGEVLTGQVRIITLQLRNPTPVPAVWERHSQNESKEGKVFTLTPSSGTLAPGKKINVEVMFTPTSESDYNARIPIKIHSNSRGKFLTCKGRGKDLNIRFNAPKITLEPTMPFAPHKRVTLEVSNPTDYPLEFFSVDFDKTYQE